VAEQRISFFSSLRFKMALTLALFGAVLIIAVMIFLESSLRQTLIRESIEKGLGIARGVAFNVEDPLLTGDDLYLFSAIKNAQKSPGIRYARIVDTHDRIRAADDVTSVETTFALPAGAVLVEQTPSYQVRRFQQGNETLLDLKVPILTIANTPVQLGTIHLGLSETVITGKIRAMHNNLVLLVLSTLAISVLVAHFLAGFSVRPFNILVRGVRAIGAGDLDQHIELNRRDEFLVLANAFNDMAANLREKEFIKRTFERYVSKELAQQLLERRNEIKLGGDEVIVTILFADIRRFTTLAEDLPPAQVVELLNTFFSRMIRVVSAHGGIVDKLMGDSVMALFGVPFPAEDDAVRAVRCGLAMQQEVERFNTEREGQALPPLKMGIGINTGTVIAGNIGSADRMEYTVIGDNVNIAARLQGIAKPGQVLISDATWQQVRTLATATRLEPMALKGKSKHVDVYRIDSLSEI